MIPPPPGAKPSRADFAGRDPKTIPGQAAGLLCQCICWTACRRLTAFSRSRRAKAMTCCRCLHDDHADYPRLEISWAFRNHRPGRSFPLAMRARPSSRSSPPDRTRFPRRRGTLRALTQPDFDGGKIVYLPRKPDRSWPHQSTSVRLISSSFIPQQVTWRLNPLNRRRGVASVLSQLAGHGGRPAGAAAAREHAFQAVFIPSGRHGVRLEYKDRAFEIGAAISMGMWLSCLIGLRLMRKRPGPTDRHIGTDS